MRPAYGGIDFGTSNSTVGLIENGRPRLAPLEDGNVTLPSAVFFNFEDNRTYLGRRAIADYTDGAEGRLMRALKSVLGSSLVNEKTRIKARSIAFTDIIGLFIAHLKKPAGGAGRRRGGHASCSDGRCSSSTTTRKPTPRPRASWKRLPARKVSGTSRSSSSRSRRRSTTSRR